MKLFKNFAKLKKKISLIQNQKKISYDDLIKFSDKLSKNIKKNSIIILIAKNDITSISFYVSSIKNNYCLIILDENSDFDFINKTVKKFRCNYVFYPKNSFYFNKKKNKKFYFNNYCLEEVSTKIQNFNYKNSIILTTSGTTASPKFVRLSNENLYKNSKQIINYLRINRKDKTITTLPMAYSFGLSIINSHLESGSIIVINNEPIFSKKFWEIIKKNKIVSFGTVPMVYDYLRRIKFENLIYSSLKYLTVAGGNVSKDTLIYLLDICKKNKIKFFVMYGQTEASPRMSYYEMTKYPEKIGSIGRPVQNARFEIHNKELVFFGENVSLGYAKNFQDLKKGDVNRGKIKTGDLGYRDQDQFYYLSGRKKKISKLFGLRIDLKEIEIMLNKKKMEVKALIDDKKLKIECLKGNDNEKIKELIFKKYKINKNFIEIIEKSNFSKNTNYKNLYKNENFKF